jgi:hypothetical protein
MIGFPRFFMKMLGLGCDPRSVAFQTPHWRSTVRREKRNPDPRLTPTTLRIWTKASPAEFENTAAAAIF